VGFPIRGIVADTDAGGRVGVLSDMFELESSVFSVMVDREVGMRGSLEEGAVNV
jgi:hypothetical protein